MSTDLIENAPMEIEQPKKVTANTDPVTVKIDTPVKQKLEKPELQQQISVTKKVVPASEKKTSTKKKRRKITKTKKVIKKTTVTTRKIVRRRRLTSEHKFKIKPMNFKAWKDDEFVIGILQKRGWNYQGEPIEEGREDYPNSMYDALEEGKIPDEPCLYWADDDDSKVLKGFSSQHIISSIPNADKALSKVYQQKMFHEYQWFPKCFTLPKEKALLAEYLNENPESYWICKPRDSYGGFGMCVYKAGTPEFNTVLDRKCTFALQRYMENPYLFAGLYKFHLRCYMIIANVDDPYRAYLWKNAQIQFATHKFDLNQIAKNFNKYSHITNYKVNNEKKNVQYVVQEKPGIGAGTEWSLKKFFEAMKSEPKFSEDRFWQDLTSIAKVVGHKLATCSHVKRGLRTPYQSTNHFEIYGLDIIMDEDCNLALTEANTQPGLDWTNPTMPNGVFNPEIVEANNVTEGIVNDSITLLGLDGKKRKFTSPWVRLHH